MRAVARHNMIKPGDTVTVCLSGGADSMSLFHFLCLNKDFLKIDKLIALHVNHGLRDESRREEVFVKDYCRKMGIECVVYSAKMREREAPKGLSTEMWARQLRYDFFFEQAEKYGAKLATAHTASDRRETILFNITRGSSLKGAVGIPRTRDNIIRPLINCTREEVEKYCRENRIPFVTDKTNFQDDYSRNKIRLNVIPQLEKINTQVVSSISSFGDEAGEIYTFLTQLSDTLYKDCFTDKGIDCKKLARRPAVVAKNLIRNILDDFGALSKENVLDIYSSLGQDTFKKQLGTDKFCRIKNGYLTFYNREKPAAAPQAVRVKIGEETIFGSRRFKIDLVDKAGYEKIKKTDKKHLLNAVNCDIIRDNLFFRSRQAKDSFTLPGRNVTKTLKKLFIEDKIPRRQRDSLAVLSDSEGNVIWLEGYGTNKPYLPSQHTEKILIIRQM